MQVSRVGNCQTWAVASYRCSAHSHVPAMLHQAHLWRTLLELLVVCRPGAPLRGPRDLLSGMTQGFRGLTQVQRAVKSQLAGPGPRAQGCMLA